MLAIPCPHCGVRDEAEFRFGGELVTRPPGAVDDAAWSAYLFERRARRGLQLERWLHAYGCERWFVLERDSISHQVIASHVTPPAGEA